MSGSTRGQAPVGVNTGGAGAAPGVMTPAAGGALSTPPPVGFGGMPFVPFPPAMDAEPTPLVPDPVPCAEPTSEQFPAVTCSSSLEAPLELDGVWQNEAARVTLTFEAGRGALLLGDAGPCSLRDPRTSAPETSFWTMGVDECCPDAASADDDWRWPAGIDPPARCAGVVNPALDSCGSVDEGMLPIEGEMYSLEEVCLPADDLSSDGLSSDGMASVATPRRSFQFRPTDAWRDFCAGAESVRCEDVLAATGGDFCDDEFICNYRYEEVDQIVDFCSWFQVCACDEQGCTTNNRTRWRYTIEPGVAAGELYARISLVNASTGEIGFESIGFALRRVN